MDKRSHKNGEMNSCMDKCKIIRMRIRQMGFLHTIKIPSAFMKDEICLKGIKG